MKKILIAIIMFVSVNLSAAPFAPVQVDESTGIMYYGDASGGVEPILSLPDPGTSLPAFRVGAELVDGDFVAVAVNSNAQYIVACPNGNTSGFLVSTNSGSSWTTNQAGVGDWIRCDVTPDGKVMAVANDHGNEQAVYLSTNYGASFASLSSLPNSGQTQAFDVQLSDDGTNILVSIGGIYDDGYYSTNQGSTFTLATSDSSMGECAISADGQIMIFGRRIATGIARSMDGGSTWTNIAGVGSPKHLRGSETLQYILASGNGGTYDPRYSTDYGSTWTVIDEAPDYDSVYDNGVGVSADGVSMVGLTDYTAIPVYSSADSGANFTAMSSARLWTDISIYSNSYAYVASADGIYSVTIRDTVPAAEDYAVKDEYNIFTTSNRFEGLIYPEDGAIIGDTGGIYADIGNVAGSAHHLYGDTFIWSEGITSGDLTIVDGSVWANAIGIDRGYSLYIGASIGNSPISDITNIGTDGVAFGRNYGSGYLSFENHDSYSFDNNVSVTTGGMDIDGTLGSGYGLDVQNKALFQGTNYFHTDVVFDEQDVDNISDIIANNELRIIDSGGNESVGFLSGSKYIYGASGGNSNVKLSIDSTASKLYHGSDTKFWKVEGTPAEIAGDGEYIVNYNAMTSYVASAGDGTPVDSRLATNSIIPDTDATYSLGSSSQVWAELYVGTGSVHVGGADISADVNSNLVLNADREVLVGGISDQGAYDLQVNGASYFSGAGTFKDGITATGGSSNNKITSEGSGAAWATVNGLILNDTIANGYEWAIQSGAADTGSLVFRSGTNSGTSSQSAGVTHMFLNESGELIIGSTDNGAYDLQVNGASYFSGGVLFNAAATMNSTATFKNWLYGVNSDAFLYQSDAFGGLIRSASGNEAITMQNSAGSAGALFYTDSGDLTLGANNASHGNVVLRFDPASSMSSILNFYRNNSHRYSMSVNASDLFTIVDMTDTETNLMMNLSGEVIVGGVDNGAYDFQVNGDSIMTGTLGVGGATDGVLIRRNGTQGDIIGADAAFAGYNDLKIFNNAANFIFLDASPARMGFNTGSPSAAFDFVGDMEVNGSATVTNEFHVPNMKTGTNQVAAGAAAGELWADSDDDYTVKLGQ